MSALPRLLPTEDLTHAPRLPTPLEAQGAGAEGAGRGRLTPRHPAPSWAQGNDPQVPRSTSITLLRGRHLFKIQSSLSPVNRDTTTNILEHACGQMLPEVFDEISKKLLGIRSSTTCSCSPEMLPSRRSSEQAAIINHLTEFTPQQQVQVQSPPPASAPAPRAAVEVAPPTVVPPPPVGREKLFLQLR